MSKIERIAMDLLEPYIEDKDIEVVDIEYVKEGKDWYLRVYIDKPEGISIEDCEDLSRYLSDRLDEVDPIKHKYILEVSSPGIERPLKKPKDYERFKGEKIYVKLYQPVDGRKEFVGLLKDYRDGNVYIEIVQGEIMAIPLEKISLARLHFEF
ncbi:ribosome maturation factor RimP [Caldanaerobius fijiensis DSM 17918]|uniref:Ribosome maturation factor RimP n=1 Tax=Caldanaerobius fijiensis DSM 17918 TaxID=1121256 RepID=A0A1M4WSY0_9THEO|nr:ribosome maturation factor RimP [Caldanaerobius fijiensis]SHE84318.1 ribosome maturation factor RimP [Caldanaerobius fijiensis DSM 17918]